MGAWLKVNGAGIYNSKPIAPYSSENVALTQSKDGSIVYAFYLGQGKQIILPAQVTIDNFKAGKISRISLLGIRSGAIKWRQEGKKLVIAIPPSLQNKLIGEHAVTFRIQR